MQRSGTDTIKHHTWPQRSDLGEARTRSPSVSSQALNHWATALPINDTISISIYQI